MPKDSPNSVGTAPARPVAAWRRPRVWKRGLGDAVFAVAATWIALRHPPEARQHAAQRLIDRLHGHLLRFHHVGDAEPRYRSDPRASVLNAMLGTMTRRHRGFALRTRLRGGDLLRAALAEGRGLVLCTIHTRLTLSVHERLRQEGADPVFVGIPGQDRRGWHWGSTVPVEVEDSSNPHVFVRCRDHARRGRVLVAFVDYVPDEPASRPNVGDVMPGHISPNAFAWAAAERVPVLFLTTRYGSDGHIDIELAAPPEGCASGTALARAFRDWVARETHWPWRITRPKHAARAA